MNNSWPSTYQDARKPDVARTQSIRVLACACNSAYTVDFEGLLQHVPGITLFTADTPLALQEEVLASKPHLVVCLLNLTHPNELHKLQIYRSQTTKADIPWLIVAMEYHSGLITQAHQMGFTHIIPGSPLTPSQLEVAILLATAPRQKEAEAPARAKASLGASLLGNLRMPQSPFRRHVRQQLPLHFMEHPLPMILWNQEGCVTAWNKAAQQLLGWAQEEVLGKHPTDWPLAVCSPELAEAVAATFIKAITQPELSQQQLFTRELEPVNCEWWNSPMLLDNVQHPAIFTVIRQNQPVKVVRQPHFERFKQTFQQAGVGMAHIDVDGRWFLFNDAYCQILGRKPEELTFSKYEQMIHPDDLPELRQHVRQLFAGRVESLQVDVRFLHGQGHYIWGHLVINTPHDQDRGKYLLVILYDVSGQKQAEQELLATNALLDTFVYRASHDLKGPITSILGLAQVAAMEQEQHKLPEYIQMIQDTATRMDRLLRALMSASQIKNAQQEVEAVDFTLLLQELEEKLQFVEGFAECRVWLHLDGPVHYSADYFLLSTVLYNLLENAILYRNRDRADAFVELRICTCNHPQGIVVSIEDNGIGIAAEQQGKIWDMFYRGSAASRGAGLGLYIVHTALQQLNGSIKLQSQPKEGSIFQLTIPSFM